MGITQRICDICGTEVLVEEESGAEAHRDITYKDCGVEGELNKLADHIEGLSVYGKAKPSRHLRSL